MGNSKLATRAEYRSRATANRMAYLEARVVELESLLRLAELRARLADLALQQNGLSDTIPFAAFSGELLRAERTRMGFTQYDLADRTGYPQAQIAQWETDVYRPHWHAAYDLAQALETETMAFFDAERIQHVVHIISSPVMDFSLGGEQ